MNDFMPCKWCKGIPKHRMYKGIFHQYVCHCQHRTVTDELTAKGAKEQWNAQNGEVTVSNSKGTPCYEQLAWCENRISELETLMQEKLKQQHWQTIVELAEWCNEENIPLEKTSRIVFSADELLIDNNREDE